MPYSLHWQQMAQAGAIEWPRSCPPWKTQVKITPVEEGVQHEGKPLPKDGAVLPWSPALRDLLLQQRVHIPVASGEDPTPAPSPAPAAAEAAAPLAPAEKE